MDQPRKINSALISVFYKDGLEHIVKRLNELGIKLYSTGGTEKFIRECGVDVIPVETLTSYPSILGGRVKTLHPSVFGGILARRDHEQDLTELSTYEIPEIDLIIVDLYPFEESLKAGADHDEMIEKIDIGGISLIRAAAKNYEHVLIASSKDQYSVIREILDKQDGISSIDQRRQLARDAFQVTSHYDTLIFDYFNSSDSPLDVFKRSVNEHQVLRYGENPHQKGIFYGRLRDLLEQLGGKELSYNNLVDIDAAIRLIDEFETPTFAVLKHTNACGLASRDTLLEAWTDALAADPVSAFGGVLICNRTLDPQTAAAIQSLFFEVLIAPAYHEDAIRILREKKNRILLSRHDIPLPKKQFKTILNGIIEQDQDLAIETQAQMTKVTAISPTDQQKEDLFFALKLVKHTKSNAIILAKNGSLLASGVGQTSRVDALQQAIHKAATFGFDLNGSVMASDAFFPFPDCVEIAAAAGIKAIIQPGGSIKDQNSIDAANRLNIAMVTTGVRHFKH